MAKKRKAKKTPADQAIGHAGARAAEGAGKGGVVAPAEHRFKPGQSGNPSGRPAIGASTREWMNALQDATEAELRAIARGKSEPAARRGAAIEILKMITLGDVADFQKLCEGEVTLEELRAAGTDTSVIKRFKPTKRTFTNSRGGLEIVETVELELHDRTGESLDRVIGQTDGHPTQRVQVDDAGALPHPPALVLIGTPEGFVPWDPLPAPPHASTDPRCT
jgi:hypothetical protein